MGNKGSRRPEAVQELSSGIEQTLRALLREHRRRLDDPSYDDAEAEETKIKDLERSLDALEVMLKRAQPQRR